MSNKVEPVITGINNITPVGDSAEMTAVSIRAGISRLEYSNYFFDSEHNSIKQSCIDGFDKNSFDKNSKDSSEPFMNGIAKKCLNDFLNQTFKESTAPEKIHFLIGLPSEQRPGEKFDSSDLVKEINVYTSEVITEQFTTGNPSAIHALERAVEIINAKPDALCIVGVIDSLLEPATLDWFEEKKRLNSESEGRNQSFSASQAVAFFSVESKKSATDRKRTILAGINGFKTTKEPAPFVTDKPSKGEGLTTAVRSALAAEATTPESIDHVMCDMNGEFYRSKEWGYAELRCLGNSNKSRKLWHPADCIGNSGAASAGVLLTIAVEGLQKSWLEKKVLVFSTDDHGDCGAVILSKVEV